MLLLITTPPGPYYRLKGRTLAATAQKKISQSFHQQQRENNFSSFDFGVSSVRNKSESLQVDVTASFQQQPVSTQICTRKRTQERLIHATCVQCPLCDFYRSLETFICENRRWRRFTTFFCAAFCKNIPPQPPSYLYRPLLKVENNVARVCVTKLSHESN